MRILAALVLASVALAQDVSVTLATKDGRTKFRMGEVIDLDLRFRAAKPNQYRVDTMDPTRHARIPKYDRFFVEPAADVVDPLRESPALREGGGVFEGNLAVAVPLIGPAGVRVRLQLNGWVTFRRPGRYRVSVETKRVVDVPPLRSKPIELEIVAPEPGWADAQVRRAVAVLERPPLRTPEIGEGFDPRVYKRFDEEMAQAARTLRFLETPASARAMVRFFENGPYVAREDLGIGLLNSLFRKDIIAAMEERLVAPDTPITGAYLFTLTQLAAIARFGPMPWAGGEAVTRSRLYPIRDEYSRKLAAACKYKRGRALAISLDGLTLRAEPAPAWLRQALMENLHLLPEEKQNVILEMNWYRVGSPTAEPALAALAAGRSLAADAALARLQDINPQRARKITLDRIRAGDVRDGFGSHPRVLLSLPDATLPEMDGPLADALERGKPVQLLIARYASPAAFARVRAWAEAHPEGWCHRPLAAYFFRVNARYAATQFRACAVSLESDADLLMSPGLEQKAIADLADPSRRSVAAGLLREAGSARAEQALWNALERHPGDDALIDALATGWGWALSPDELKRLAAVCRSSSCRQRVEKIRLQLKPPVKIELVESKMLYAELGPYGPCSREQLVKKIRQFPRGTPFLLGEGSKGYWFREHRVDEIRRILRRADMRVAE